MILICRGWRGCSGSWGTARDKSSPQVSMLRCLFTSIVSDFSRSARHVKRTRSDLVITGQFYSTQATKMELKTAADKRYQSAITALNGLQSNLQNLAIKDDKRKNKIFSTIKFAERIGISLADIDKLSIIHVSGTKGKGSTCAMSESILRHHGYKTGFFSSPHLVEVRERIQINGQPISREMFSSYFWDVYEKLRQTAPLHDNEMPFYFAFLTVMAFKVFVKEQVDVAIMEVGIGGEYDNTNVVQRPVVCGVTSLGLDHVSVLGDTIEQIAWQKGGIFKPGVPAVTMPQDMSALKVLLDRSEEIGCPLYLTPDFESHKIRRSDPDFHLGLMGSVQEKNAALALQLCRIWLAYKRNGDSYMEMSKPQKHSHVGQIPVLEAYRVDEGSKQALQRCCWRGRNQILSKLGVTYYIDGAHTKESLEQCIDWFKEESSSESALIRGKVVKILLFNMTGDRDIKARLTQLKSCAFDHVVFSPNSLFVDITSPDLTKISVTMENQLNRCSMMKEIWDQGSSQGHLPGSKDQRSSQGHLPRSEVRHPQVQFVEELGQLPVVPVELEGPDNGATVLVDAPRVHHIPSSVITCLSAALHWATQGRDKSLPACTAPPCIPEYLQTAEHIQVLVTGSLHLVGGVLKLIEPVVSPDS